MAPWCASRGSTFFGRRSGLSFARAASSRRALVMQSGHGHPAGAASPGGTGLISPSPERSAQLPGKVGSVDEFLDRPVQQAVPVQPPQYFGSLPVSDRPVTAGPARIFTCGWRELSPRAAGSGVEELSAFDCTARPASWAACQPPSVSCSGMELCWVLV